MGTCSSIYIEFKKRFDEIFWLKVFAAGIGLIHEFLTDDWFSEESVRLVFYSC